MENQRVQNLIKSELEKQNNKVLITAHGNLVSLYVKNFLVVVIKKMTTIDHYGNT